MDRDHTNVSPHPDAIAADIGNRTTRSNLRDLIASRCAISPFSENGCNLSVGMCDGVPLLPLSIILVGIVQITALFFFARTSYFFADDWLNFSIALHENFSRTYLARGEFGHFVPMHRVINYVVVKIFPLHYQVCLGFMLLLYAAMVWYLGRLLRSLCHPSWGQFVLLFLFGFSAIYASILQWWAAALNFVPAAFFSLVCIDGFLCHIRTRRFLPLLISVGAMCIGFLFHETPVLVPLYLVLLTPLVLSEETTPAAMMRAVRRYWRAWIAYFLPCAFYVWNYYVHHYYDRTTPHPPPGQLLAYLGRAGAEFVLAYFNVAVQSQKPGWHSPMVVGSLLLLAGLIGMSLVRNRRVWRVWAFFFAAFTANMVLIGWARLGLFGPSIATDIRYTYENTYLFTVALGMAFLPRGDRYDSVIARAPAPRRGWKGRVPPYALPVALAVVCCTHLVMFIASASVISARSDGRSNRIFVDNFRLDLAALEMTETPVSFFDLTVPFVVVPPAFQPYDRYSYVLPQISPAIVFNQASPVQHYVGDDGHIYRAVIVPGAAFDPKTQGTSNLRVTGGTVEMRGDAVCLKSRPNVRGMFVEFPLTTALPKDAYFWRMAYHSDQSVMAHIALLPVESGEFIDATGGGARPSLSPDADLFIASLTRSSVRAVRLEIEPNAELCISSLAIGSPIRVP